MDFDSIGKAGSMLGSAGTIVVDDSTCMVWVARKLAFFYKHESCGKCSPCREGTGWLLRLLDKIEEGKGTERDLEILATVCDSIAGKTVCAFGDAAATPPHVHPHEVPRRVRVPRAREALLEAVAGTFAEARGPGRRRRSRAAVAAPVTLTPDAAGAGHHRVKVVVLLNLLLMLFSGMTYVERRLLAFMQFRLGPNRTGPFGLLQPIADGIKLFFKEEVVPEGANKWLFVAAPGARHRHRVPVHRRRALRRPR